jgi:hypothetical protein
MQPARQGCRHLPSRPCWTSRRLAGPARRRAPRCAEPSNPVWRSPGRSTNVLRRTTKLGGGSVVELGIVASENQHATIMAQTLRPKLGPIAVLHLDTKGYLAFLNESVCRGASCADALSLVIVHAPIEDLPGPGMLPIVVAAIGGRLGAPGPVGADVVVGEGELDDLIGTVDRFPVASTSLRSSCATSIRYRPKPALRPSRRLTRHCKQEAEFAAWRATSDPAFVEQVAPAVVLDRGADRLTITLNRPHRHNAISRQLRDELCAALRLAIADETIVQVRLVGAGPSFCSGGDLAEFGARTDPADAHRVRLAQSPARLLERLRTRTTAFVHGCTLGGGIEMAAFAHQVVADPETRIGLPEVRMGWSQEQAVQSASPAAQDGNELPHLRWRPSRSMPARRSNGGSSTRSRFTDRATAGGTLRRQRCKRGKDHAVRRAERRSARQAIPVSPRI